MTWRDGADGDEAFLVVALQGPPSTWEKWNIVYAVGGLERYGDDEDWSLWQVLQESVDDWQEVFDEYWRDLREYPGVSPEDIEWWDRMHKVAPRLLSGALALRMSAMTPDQKGLVGLLPEIAEAIRRLLAIQGETRIVRDRWSFGVAMDALERLEGSSHRVADLLNVILACRLDERTSAYLSRVARLYVYGFDVEALVMCRSALDTALQDVLPDEVMARMGFIRPGPEYSLSTRIAAAEQAGYFDSSKKEAAHLLRKASNDALHTAPDFLREGVPSAREAIRLLAGLLESLSVG